MKRERLGLHVEIDGTMRNFECCRKILSPLRHSPWDPRAIKRAACYDPDLLLSIAPLDASQHLGHQQARKGKLVVGGPFPRVALVHLDLE